MATNRDKNMSEDGDIRVNSSATDAQLAWLGEAEAGSKKRHSREDLEAYETAYNAGCVALARGDLREAEVLLRTARGRNVDFHRRAWTEP